MCERERQALSVIISEHHSSLACVRVRVCVPLVACVRQRVRASLVVCVKRC